jgi:outer membrane protein OmpA-like peptidoglycan-associated protein
MTRKSIFIILIVSFSQIIFGQSETYIIEKAPFNSGKYDEFSPVFYKSGIVFTSNRITGLSSHSTSDNKGLFKICYVDTLSKSDWANPKLFSKNLTTVLNDGPVTFNKAGDTIYFSRNQDVSSKLADLSGPRNKLGIFYAVLIDGQWSKIRELRINNEWYNITTPWLSPDGKKLYFASDKPGGFGGSDLYYSIKKVDRWEDPVNLGPVINTAGNESYPFMNSSGDLFFSSDGRHGMGGKDIYFSLYVDSAWQVPVLLESPINSKFDDFGIVTNPLMTSGYFSSNRDKSVDIFSFQTKNPQVLYNTIQKENPYCFLLSDSGSMTIDNENLKYVWDFGDGSKAIGEKVNHCFRGAGKYIVKVDIVEKNTGNLFFSKLAYNLELLDHKQPFINSPDFCVVGENVNFDGLKSNVPGFRILNYTWDFGDRSKSYGDKVSYTFKEKGEYFVNLELTLLSELTGNMHKTGVSKKVQVLTSSQEKDSYLNKQATDKAPVKDIEKSSNAKIDIIYSTEKELLKDVVFNVELISSQKKIALDSWTFRNVPKKYTITEKFDRSDSTYKYIVDQQMSLMATYPAFNELYTLGFKKVKINLFVITDPSEKELHNLIKINGAFADSYFDSSDRLTSNAYIMLDQIVKLMNKYPAVRLEVAVHSDNSGPAEASLTLTQLKAKLLVDYLINRGINSRRLIGTGFGGSRPIVSNQLEKDRKLNRRIDFILLK